MATFEMNYGPRDSAADKSFKVGDRVAYDENLGTVSRIVIANVRWDNGYASVVSTSDLTHVSIKPFSFIAMGDGLTRLVFPNSEHYCCDGEPLSRDDMRALRDALTEILGDG
jgi:hypothetical protein